MKQLANAVFEKAIWTRRGARKQNEIELSLRNIGWKETNLTWKYLDVVQNWNYLMIGPRKSERAQNSTS